VCNPLQPGQELTEQREAQQSTSSNGSAGHHLNTSVLHLLQARLSKLTQLRRQADLFSDLIETQIPDDHISKWIGPSLEDLRITAGVHE